LKSIHLIAPSGASLDNRSPLAGIDWLRKQGLSVANANCVERVYQRFAGNDAERLSELNGLSQIPSDSIVMATRGGYGLHRLLPDMQWDAIAEAIHHGAQVCGHSDFTVFQLALLAKTGSVSLAGPMLNFDFGRLDEQGVHIEPDSFMWRHFRNAIEERRLDIDIQRPQRFLGTSLQGAAAGMLWGGNLTVLAGLIGTPYLPTDEQISGGILFLEDVNEHPYRIERMLMQLLDAGVLSSQAAIMLGGFSAYRLYENDRGYNLDAAIEIIRQRVPQTIPIITDLPFGHQAEKLTLPVGAQAQLAYQQSGFTLKARW
jgi:muramoyltetrapeptide carboxypeptidase